MAFEPEWPLKVVEMSLIDGEPKDVKGLPLRSVENSHRLRTLRLKGDFDELRQKGRYLKAAPWLIVQYKSNNLDEIRPAWTLSRRTAKAVIRNRMKRWAREYFRGLEHPPSLNLNLIFKSPKKGFFEKLDHEEFKKALSTSMEKISHRIK